MSEEINIQVKNGWNYKFHTADYDALIHDTRQCSYCKNTYFNNVYCFIVDSLKEAGLLHEDFEEICCCCLILRHFGLMDLLGKLRNFTYREEDDYLLIEFTLRTKVTKIMSEFIIITIGIHDWSKIRLF